MKDCSKCGKPKELKEYSSNAARKDGLQSQCKSCMSLVAKARWAKGGDRNYESREDKSIVYRNFKCKRCDKPTRFVYVDKADIARLKNTFYCSGCNELIAGDDTDFCAHTYNLENTNASELPYMDSVGSDLRFGGTFN